MANINSLLSKKGWTGEEVGKALMASLLNDIKHIGQEYNLLFTPEDFAKMEDSLKTERDYTAYGVYRDIYSSVVDNFNKANALHQQFYNGYYRYLMYLNGAMDADKALENTEQYPLIMTAEQYQRAEKETLERKKRIGESFYSLLFVLLEDFLDALDEGEADRVPADIKKAVEALKKEPAEGHAIYSSYNELTLEGYLQLPDGRRSDEMTTEEWQNALKDLYLNRHKLTVNGQEATPEETLRHFNEDRTLNACTLLYKGIDAINQVLADAGEEEIPAEKEQEVLAELERAIDGETKGRSPLIRGLLKALDYITPSDPEWHTYPDPPADLTAYDLLDLIADSSRYGSTDQKEHLKTFKKEYPALYTALESYINDKIPNAKELKPSQLYKPFVSWGTLAELKIAKYAELINPEDTDIIQHLQEQGLKFADRKRASLRGIAVIQHPRKFQLDESGDYKESDSPLCRYGSIDDLAGDEYVDLPALRDTLFIPALSYIYAYNALIEIIGAVYDIADIEIAELSPALFESQLRALNNLLYMFHYEVYGDKEEKARKRELIKELFAPLDVESIKPTEEAKEAVRGKLAKLGISSSARQALKDFDALIMELDNREGAY